ncbi:MAG: NADH-quinone oxidoreductase subunit NuoE [Pseudomonadota bacterium]
MSLRRLYHKQPESFSFTPANQEWAEGQLAKYPEGRQASAVIPLLWRAQEQEGWITRPIIETVAQMLSMPQIRVLEVATFYFMFQLQPVGSMAHFQVCGTTSCMICGAEDLIEVCRSKIAEQPHALSADGKFSWEEVECLGACANAPMVQIGKDYYEDLTAERFAWILDELSAGRVPVPGPQNGRFASEPLGGQTSLSQLANSHEANASVTLARTLGDTVKRIEGTERTASDLARAKDLRTPQAPLAPVEALPAHSVPTDEEKPELLAAPRGGRPDDLTRIRGIGRKLEVLLHDLGIYHLDQVASWTAREVAWVDHHLEGFKGRVERDNWVAQAKKLVRAREAGSAGERGLIGTE